MITILFWNVGARARRGQIADLAVNYNVDVLLLAEVVDDIGSAARKFEPSIDVIQLRGAVGKQ